MVRRSVDPEEELRMMAQEVRGILRVWRKNENEENESSRGHQDQQLKRGFLGSTKLHVCFPH